jgi:hypothetical protein
MSKDLYFEMKAENLVKLYDHSFTKKEAQKTGVQMVKTVIDEGNINIHEFMANLARLKEVVNSADAEARKHLPEEKFEAFGVEFTPVNGGSTLNYKDDEVWSDLKKQLTDREEMLKTAAKTDSIIYDSEGFQVPKVSSNQRKSSITIKF